MTSSTSTTAADTRPRWWQRLSRSGDDTRTAYPDTSEAAAVEDLFQLTVDSLQRCGFGMGEFELKVMRRAPHQPPVLMVELGKVSPAVWDFTSHLEAYLVDRLRRHGGFSVDKILFTPKRRHVPDLAEARNGVRAVWSALQSSRGQSSPSSLSAAGPDASHPNLAPAAVASD